jgi:hypothetical protein
VWEPFTALTNEIYSALKPSDTKTPQFSLARLMIVMWRRHVYDHLAAKVNQGILQLVNALRTTGFPEFEYEDLVALATRAIEALVDISVNESTVFNLKSRGFEVEGPYGCLVEALEEATNSFYTHFIEKSSFDEIVGMYQSEQILISRILVAGSVSRFLTLGNKVFVNKMLLFFKNQYTTFNTSAFVRKQLTEKQRATYVESYFGCFLFRLAPS